MLVVACAVLWSSSGFFAKAEWFDDWPLEVRGLGLAFWRAIVAGAVLLPLVRRPRFRWPMIPMGLCFALMTWSFLTAMVRGSATGTIWLQYLAPVWVALVGWAGLGDRPQRRDAWMIGAGLAGVGLILVMEADVQRMGPSLLAVLSGVAFAGVLLCYRKLGEEDGAWLGIVNHAATVVCLAPWMAMVVVADDAAVPLPWPRGFQWLAVIAFGTLQLGLPYLLFARASRHLPAYEIALLCLLEPILVPVWTFAAWHHLPSYQPPEWWIIVGAAIIGTGLVIRYWPRRHLDFRPSRGSGELSTETQRNEGMEEWRKPPD